MKKRRTFALVLLVVLLIVGVSLGLSFREYRREQRGQALIVALKANDTPRALAALTAHADPNFRDPGDTPPSFWDYLRTLWRQLRGVRQTGLTTRLSALGLAVQHDNVKLAEALLAAGAQDPGDLLGDHRYVGDEKPLPLLMAAAAQGDPAMIKALVQHGWNVNAVYTDRRTALFYTDDPATVKALVACGANVNARDQYGATALDNALSSEARDVVNALLDLGARDAQAIPLTARKCHAETLQRMLNMGWPCDVPDKYGVTPLMLALESSAEDYPKTALLLLQKGAKADFRNSRGDSPLMRAAEGGFKNYDEQNTESAPILKILLEQGAQVNAPREDGMTPLMISAQNWHPALVRLLLQHGAQVNMRTPHGDTALSLTRSGPENENLPTVYRNEVIQILKAAGATE